MPLFAPGSLGSTTAVLQAAGRHTGSRARGRSSDWVVFLRGSGQTGPRHAGLRPAVSSKKSPIDASKTLSHLRYVRPACRPGLDLRRRYLHPALRVDPPRRGGGDSDLCRGHALVVVQATCCLVSARRIPIVAAARAWRAVAARRSGLRRSPPGDHRCFGAVPSGQGPGMGLAPRRRLAGGPSCGSPLDRAAAAEFP